MAEAWIDFPPGRWMIGRDGASSGIRRIKKY
jgi:hypothetical protein